MSRKKPYYPDILTAQILWLDNFARFLPDYIVKYGISTDERDDVVKGVKWLLYWYAISLTMKTFSTNVIAFRNEIGDGVEAGSDPSVTPTLPVWDTAPPSVPPGIVNRIKAIAARIKNHTSYTTADGDKLRLEGAEPEVIDWNTVKPVITAEAGIDLVTLGWGKQNLPVEAITFEVDRGATGTFVYRGTDTTTPTFIDNDAFPAEEQLRLYRGCYLRDGIRVGQWSEVVKVRVKAA